MSTILPGYIATDINVGRRGPFTVDLDTGVDALTAAIEREPVRGLRARVAVAPVARLLRVLPLSSSAASPELPEPSARASARSRTAAVRMVAAS